MESPLTWIKLEEATTPHFTIGNITDYFISRVATDGQPTNDYNSHAYPLFKAGHIQSICVAMQHYNYINSCVCLPEMKKDILYNIKLITIDSSGVVPTASCGCPVGAGPKGSCKNIFALCYAVKDYCRIMKLRSQSCTSQLQKWNQPRKRRLESRSVEDISFEYEYGKKKKIAQSVMYDPHPPHMRSTTESYIQSLRDDLSTGKDIADKTTCIQV